MKLIQDLGYLEYGNQGRKTKYGIFECPKCKCEIKTTFDNVKRNLSKGCFSCGKKEASIKRTIHGDTRKRLFTIWVNLKQRCYNPNCKEYKFYGLIGITIFDQWKHDYKSFKKWALNNGYQEGLTIDKDIICEKENIHPKIYSPDTCMWITKRENSMEANKRSGRMKIIYQYDFDKNLINTYFSQNEASRQTNISQGNIGMVLRGKRKSAGGFIWER